MNWYYVLSQWEYVFGAAFISAYVLYLIRIAVAARKLGTYSSAVAGKMLLRFLYFGLLVLALLGPSFGAEKREIKAEGRDIYITIDLSKSMDATDIVPTRLERLKYELTKLIERFDYDRIGLIIFSSEAFVQCPLTYDKNALRLFIETLHTGLVPGTGTNITEALRLALDKHLDIENTTARNTAKVIVLFTDGENFGEENKDLLDEIENSGVNLFIVGIGSESGSKLRVGNRFKKNAEGELVITKLESAYLQSLAKRTNGTYNEITQNKNEMAKLATQIARVEGQLRDKREIDVSANKYEYLLLAALALIILDVLIAVTTIRF
jgi:Ca-activated chloride channel family protein